jgi:hypothetical protein
MRFSNILIIVVIVILIVIINFIMKTKKTKEPFPDYGIVTSETPYPELNKQISMFSKIYEKNITPSIGLSNNIINYY